MRVGGRITARAARLRAPGVRRSAAWDRAQDVLAHAGGDAHRRPSTATGRPPGSAWARRCRRPGCCRARGCCRSNRQPRPPTAAPRTTPTARNIVRPTTLSTNASNATADARRRISSRMSLGAIDKARIGKGQTEHRSRRSQRRGAGTGARMCGGRTLGIGKSLEEFPDHRLRIEPDGVRVGAYEGPAIQARRPSRHVVVLEPLEQRAEDLRGFGDLGDRNLAPHPFGAQTGTEAVRQQRVRSSPVNSGSRGRSALPRSVSGLRINSGCIRPRRVPQCRSALWQYTSQRRAIEIR